MKASKFIEKVKQAIDKYGDLPVEIDGEVLKRLKFEKEGPYSPLSTKDTRNKTFLNIINGNKF